MQKENSFQAIKRFVPILDWLPAYTTRLLRWDMVAGITLASFVLPESMAYATLAGLPPHFGIYCCLFGGLVFAIFTTARQVAVGPTSALSLMIGSTVAVLSGGDPSRWAAIASLTALAVGGICLLAFVLKLSSLVNFISDSILLGFKAGAALSIISTQLPKLFGIEGGGANFFDRITRVISHLGATNPLVLVFGLSALLLILLGDRLFAGKPVTLVVVIASILVVSFSDLHTYGLHITGSIPPGLPQLQRPALTLNDVDGVIPLAFACFLMAYIETISAARTFALKNDYQVNPGQELLSLGVTNIVAAFSSAYVVSGGLSQSTVNEKSGAKTPMALIVCSLVLMIIMLFLTGLLANLPEVILAVIVLHAVSSLIKIKELKRVYHLSPMEFWVAMIALAAVLVFGILKGIMIAVVMSIVLLIRRMANPNVAILGRIGNSESYSDIERHPDNVVYPGILVLRIESSILYFNSAHILEKILQDANAQKEQLKLLVLDLSAAPYVDVEGSKMLLELTAQLEKRNVKLRIVEALSNVRDLMRKQGLEETVGHISRRVLIHDVVEEFIGQNKVPGAVK